MIKIKIREPIWNSKSVGIATEKIKDDILVEITYKNLKGEKPFPFKYFMKKDKIQYYPVRPAMGKVPELVIIPISNFEVVTHESKICVQ